MGKTFEQAIQNIELILVGNVWSEKACALIADELKSITEGKFMSVFNEN